MYYEIIKARHISGYKIELTFEDGSKGVADLEAYSHLDGVFRNFKDIAYFKRVYIHPELAALTWPNGEDIAPETIYSLATGEPVPEWMEA